MRKSKKKRNKIRPIKPKINDRLSRKNPEPSLFLTQEGFDMFQDWIQKGYKDDLDPVSVGADLYEKLKDPKNYKDIT